MNQELDFANEPHTDFIFGIEGDPPVLIALGVVVVALAAFLVRWMLRRRRRV